jgi:hypothetical protein
MYIYKREETRNGEKYKRYSTHSKEKSTDKTQPNPSPSNIT